MPQRLIAQTALRTRKKHKAKARLCPLVIVKTNTLEKMLIEQKWYLQSNRTRNPIPLPSVEMEGLVHIPAVELECLIPILLLVMVFQVAMVVT